MKPIIMLFILGLVTMPACPQTITTQYTNVLSYSCGPDTPVPVAVDAQPSPDSLAPPFSVAVPNGQAPRLLSLVIPAIGPFANVPGANSPFTNSIVGSRQLFRLIGN
jgi:hypothetical protein